MSVKLTPIVCGTDWQEVLTEWTIDGVVQDLAAYEWDCHFKVEQGTKQAVVVAPALATTTSGLTMTLTDTQTLVLPVGVLFFNLLATQNGWTQEVVSGTVMVELGVTTNV